MWTDLDGDTSRHASNTNYGVENEVLVETKRCRISRGMWYTHEEEVSPMAEI